jgi:hypothetical protein
MRRLIFTVPFLAAFVLSCAHTLYGAFCYSCTPLCWDLAECDCAGCVYDYNPALISQGYGSCSATACQGTPANMCPIMYAVIPDPDGSAFTPGPCQGLTGWTDFNIAYYVQCATVQNCTMMGCNAGNCAKSTQQSGTTFDCPVYEQDANACACYCATGMLLQAYMGSGCDMAACLW